MNYKKPAFWIVLASVDCLCCGSGLLSDESKIGGSNDITELLAPGSAWSYQLGYDADFPDASYRPGRSLRCRTIVKNTTKHRFLYSDTVYGNCRMVAEFYGCTPEMAGGRIGKYLLFTVFSVRITKTGFPNVGRLRLVLFWNPRGDIHAKRILLRHMPRSRGSITLKARGNELGRKP